MIPRNARAVKRAGLCSADINTSLERLKKARAVGCDPSYIGIDDYICKKLFSIRTNLLTKF
ncbi:MAG: hypothetical protein NTW09_00935 [Candidatus Omnitrophica bacterium]|nr:hypothetical protein [Candidatus Omnitrophota bacterium]